MSLILAFINDKEKYKIFSYLKLNTHPIELTFFFFFFLNQNICFYGVDFENVSFHLTGSGDSSQKDHNLKMEISKFPRLFNYKNFWSKICFCLLFSSVPLTYLLNFFFFFFFFFLFCSWVLVVDLVQFQTQVMASPTWLQGTKNLLPYLFQEVCSDHRFHSFYGIAVPNTLWYEKPLWIEEGEKKPKKKTEGNSNFLRSINHPPTLTTLPFFTVPTFTIFFLSAKNIWTFRIMN